MRKLGYVPALDGLRALAIAAVIGVHYFEFPAGGARGVDLFFVLSGFLITTLLLEERDETGYVSLRRFYARRARRLVPALAVLLAVYLVIDAAKGHDGLGAVALAGLYFGNIVQAAGHSLDSTGLNHLWSLAEEEQFYLVWPVALLALIRAKRPGVWLLAFIVTLCAYRAGLALAGASAVRIAYGPDTHADGLLIGAAVAVYRRRYGLAAPEWVGKLGVVIAFFLLFPHESTVVFSIVGLPAFELGAACLLVAAVSDTSLARGLSARPLVGLGKISYSLYLWHEVMLWSLWPLGFAGHLLALPVSLLAAVLSYRFVEQPFRRRRHAPVVAVAPQLAA